MSTTRRKFTREFKLAAVKRLQPGYGSRRQAIDDNQQARSGKLARTAISPRGGSRAHKTA
ncbi:MAG: hypothetical protein HYX27_07835 [Acidobacteria bacterium]|nr:hypothetical protein [Acidobacteriota bacterium]